MKFFLIALVVLSQACYIKSKIELKTVDRAVPLPIRSIEDLPESLDWSNHNGVNFLTIARNQHRPQYCGSCWAFGTTSALSDRFKIMRNASFPDYNIAPQIPVSCVKESDGC